jgi:hypothetical protein
MFSKDEAKQSEPKPTKAQNDEDVNAFLRPSAEKAQQQKDAAAAFLATSNRPRIDVARAQRWPGAQDIINSAAAGGKSPGPGGLKTGTRKKGLSVSFVRAVPDVIGHGGDECEEPSAEVSRRKKASNGESTKMLQPQKPQDDANLNTSIGRTPSHTEQRHSLTRTITSHNEMSPPLGQKLEMGSINTYAQAPPPPMQRMGQMGLGERPKGLTRAPTGFDSVQTGAKCAATEHCQPRIRLLARIQQHVTCLVSDTFECGADNPGRGGRLQAKAHIAHSDWIRWT